MTFSVNEEKIEIEATKKEWGKREDDVKAREVAVDKREVIAGEMESKARATLNEAEERREAVDVECRRILMDAKAAMAEAEDEVKQADRVKSSVAKREGMHLKNVEEFEAMRENLESEVETSHAEARAVKARVMEVERESKKDRKDVEDMKGVLAHKTEEAKSREEEVRRRKELKTRVVAANTVLTSLSLSRRSA